MGVRQSDLKKKYSALERKLKLEVQSERSIRPDVLLTFPYAHPARAAEVTIESQEFCAVCPWTGLPDQGTLAISYTPAKRLLELKSLKYYLLSFRQVGIVQEHAAARILEDLVCVLRPQRLTVALDYNVRGGLHTVVTVRHP